MITLITGVVGSGKTLYCIEEITKLKKGISTYSAHNIIMSNIGGFKPDYFQDTPFKYVDLNFSLFYKHLKALYEIYLQFEDKEEETDTALKEYALKNDFYNCFVIIDESHHFFDNQDKIKIWYLTYHRHLSHNVFLITQNKMLLHTKYRQLPELYIKALPSTKRVTQDFKYNTYSEFVMKDKIETITILNRPELFEMYTSGNFTKQKSYALKPLLFFVFSVVGVIGMIIFLFYFLMNNSPTPTTPPPSTTSKTSINTNNTNNINNSTGVNNSKQGAVAPKVDYNVGSDTFVLKVIFLSSLGFRIGDNYYSVEHFTKFLKNTNSKILSSKILYQDKRYLLKEYYLQTKPVLLSNWFIYDLPPPPPVEEKKSSSPFDSLKLN